MGLSVGYDGVDGWGRSTKSKTERDRVEMGEWGRSMGGRRHWVCRKPEPRHGLVALEGAAVGDMNAKVGECRAGVGSFLFSVLPFPIGSAGTPRHPVSSLLSSPRSWQGHRSNVEAHPKMTTGLHLHHP